MNNRTVLWQTLAGLPTLQTIMSFTVLLMFIGGLIALVLGAGWLVRGAAKLALSFGISPLVVGLTVVRSARVRPSWPCLLGRCWTARWTLPSAMWWAAIFSTCCSFWVRRP
jgi:hypothetical protein